MKYFLTLLGVIVLVVLIYAFEATENKVNEIQEKIEIITKESDNVVGLLSAFKTEGVEGDGNVIEQKREVSNFSKIYASRGVKVKLQKGDKQKVIVSTDSNLQEKITTKVEGGELKISVKGAIRKYSEMQVFVTFTELEKLEGSSASKIVCEEKLELPKLELETGSAARILLSELVVGELEAECASASVIEIDNLIADEIDIETSSAATVKAQAGKCNNATVEAKSASVVKLLGLEIENADAQAESAATVKISAIKNLKVQSSSAARIYYEGKPKTLVLNEGKGSQIIKQ